MARASKGARVAVAVRLPLDLLARVDAFASEAGADRTAALVELIGRGLGDDARAAGVAERVASGLVGASLTSPAGAVAISDGARLVAKKCDSKAASSPPAVRPRAPRLVGFDPVTGAPLHR